MGFKSTKHRAETTIHLPVDGGLNLGAPPSELAPNELTAAINLYYQAQSGVLTSRGGLECVTATALTAPLTAVHAFVNATIARILCVASDGKLYYLDDDELTLIGTLSGANKTNPSFLNFNQVCLIATGHTDIYTYDGSTLTTVTGSPQADAIFEMQNRVVANDTSLPDVVWMSAPEDEDDWDTVSSSAKKIPLGYGDGYRVNGFASISNTLVASKVRVEGGVTVGRKLFGIDMADIPDNWFGRYLSHNNAALSHSCIAGFGSDVFMVDSNGFKALKPTQVYGDITTDITIGNKINSQLTQYLSTATKLRFHHHLGSFLIFSSGKCYVLNPARGWTEFFFPVQINDAVELGQTQYFVGNNGHVYVLSSAASDESTPGVTTPVVCSMRHGQKAMPGSDIILKEMEVQLDVLASGDVYLETSTNSGTVLLLLSSVVAGLGGTLLVDALDDLSDATEGLNTSILGNERTRSRFRGRYIQPQIRCADGARIGIHWVKCRIAQVEG
jgi:hypothetical protein